MAYNAFPAQGVTKCGVCDKFNGTGDDCLWNSDSHRVYSAAAVIKAVEMSNGKYIYILVLHLI
jgi:hypothetical protein